MRRTAASFSEPFSTRYEIPALLRGGQVVLPLIRYRAVVWILLRASLPPFRMANHAQGLLKYDDVAGTALLHDLQVRLGPAHASYTVDPEKLPSIP